MDDISANGISVADCIPNSRCSDAHATISESQPQDLQKTLSLIQLNLDVAQSSLKTLYSLTKKPDSRDAGQVSEEAVLGEEAFVAGNIAVSWRAI